MTRLVGRTLLVLGAGAAAAAVILPATTASSQGLGISASCVDVRFVAVRGSGDTSSAFGLIGERVSGALSRPVHAAGLSYDAYGIPYTAVGIAWYKLTNAQLPEYRLSVRDGRNKLYGYLHSETVRCPEERLVVLGYSQGAQVVGDIFSKGLGRLTPQALAQIRAVVLIADPRFNSREPYDHGSFRRGRNGLLGARSPGDLSSVSGKVAAWCRKDDLVCQGPGTTGNHSQANYLHDYETQIVAFLSQELSLGARSSPIAGTWVGPVHQPGAQMPDFTVRIQLPSLLATNPGTEQLLNICDGSLTFTGRAGSAYAFRFETTSSQCVNGTVTLTPLSPTSLRYDWQGNGASSTGTLTKSP